VRHTADLFSADIVMQAVVLAPWTSVRIGGVAEAVLRPRTTEELAQVLAVCQSHALNWWVLGGGANTLVADAGVRGVVIKLPNVREEEEVVIDEAGASVTLSAGSAIARIVSVMRERKLTGVEFLAGIPGTIGGAVAMNAGTKHGECMAAVESVELVSAQGAAWVSQLGFSYRKTHLPAGTVIRRVKFRLRNGDTELSERAMEKDLFYRKSTQPLSQPNFGSVFTNPLGHFAGQLLEQAGLKGFRIGDAQFSLKHANWIVNLGKAKATDVEQLMQVGQSRVFEASGVRLTPEVKRLGDSAGAP
jgi:UDP-N-acetylmuramate dehydrogenase